MIKALCFFCEEGLRLDTFVNLWDATECVRAFASVRVSSLARFVSFGV